MIADFAHALSQIAGAGVVAYAIPFLATRGILDAIKSAGVISIEWKKFERRL